VRTFDAIRARLLGIVVVGGGGRLPYLALFKNDSGTAQESQGIRGSPQLKHTHKVSNYRMLRVGKPGIRPGGPHQSLEGKEGGKLFSRKGAAIAVPRSEASQGKRIAILSSRTTRLPEKKKGEGNWGPVFQRDPLTSLKEEKRHPRKRGLGYPGQRGSNTPRNTE